MNHGSFADIEDVDFATLHKLFATPNKTKATPMVFLQTNQHTPKPIRKTTIRGRTVHIPKRYIS